MLQANDFAALLFYLYTSHIPVISSHNTNTFPFYLHITHTVPSLTLPSHYTHIDTHSFTQHTDYIHTTHTHYAFSQNIPP